jgi:isovaleryl-CoA dehydrogenase
MKTASDLDPYASLRRSVEEFVAREIAPSARERDEKEIFDLELFRRLGEMGYLGVTVPEEYGGSGMDLRSATIILEELGYGDAGIALSVGAHAILTTHNIAVNASPEQKARYLPRLASGEWIGSYCMTEPHAGSDALRGMKTIAFRKGDRYLLRGTKTFITNAPYADLFLVYARTGSPDGPLSAFLVERNFPGVRVSPPFSKMGMRSSPTGEVTFEDVEVPVENRIGEEGTGTLQMLRNLEVERITLSGISVGIARSALDRAFRYATERRQFDQPIIEFQMIQEMLADMAIAVTTAQLLVMESARRLDENPSGRHNQIAAMAKIYSAEIATQTALKAVQILGGYGYMREYEVERLVRDAKLLEIGAGTNQILRQVVAKEMKRFGRAIV